MKNQRLKYKSHALASATLGLSLLAHLGTVQVQAVMFNFEGTIDYTFGNSDLLPEGFTMGTTVTGRVFYDPSQASLDGNFNPSFGFYIFNNPIGTDFSFSVTGGGHTISSIPTTSSPFNNVGVSNNNPNDIISYNIGTARYDDGPLPHGLTNIELTLEFRDVSATALSSDSLPTFSPSLSAFPDNPRLSFYGEDGLGDSIQFNAVITSLTPVPEPGEWAVIAGASLGAFALIRRRKGATA